MSACTTIEIGPGPGGLTRGLLAAGAARVVALEKDRRCVAALQELKEHYPGRLDIIEADALEADLIALVPGPRKIVSNLPYNVGTPLLIQWLDDISRHGPQAYASLTLMFQREVAERITAPEAGEHYGRLSVMCRWLTHANPNFDLPPGAFSPPPKVFSSVLTLTPRAAPLYPADKQALEKVLASAFGQRRKMLRQSLKTLNVPVDVLLEQAGVDGTRRAETLTVQQFCALANAYAAAG